MGNRISTGSDAFDDFLNGGYEYDTVSTIYGPAGSGKTNFCLLCLKKVVESGKKVIYIDTEGSYSIDRFKQICDDYDDILKNVLFLKPTSFLEQRNTFAKLKKSVNDKIGLIIVDTISTFYRLEVGKNKEIYEVSRIFGGQLSNLVEITRKHNIPILVTSQVYSKMENNDDVRIVGGDVIKYSSKCLIELKKFKTKRAAIIRKHRSIPEGKEFIFRIVNNGIEEEEK